MEEALLRLVGEKEPKKLNVDERIRRLELKVAVLEERLSRKLSHALDRPDERATVRVSEAEDRAGENPPKVQASGRASRRRALGLCSRSLRGEAEAGSQQNHREAFLNRRAHVVIWWEKAIEDLDLFRFFRADAMFPDMSKLPNHALKYC